jgi:hypothetical protein
MQPLSAAAAAILDHMEPRRPYDGAELQALLPNTSMDGVRDLMHELWLKRRVERFGYSAWRRHESTPVSSLSPDDGRRTVREFQYVPVAGSRPVRPEDLFDYSAFDGIFK